MTQDYQAINGGKWNGMMLKVHIIYVIWNDPTQQTMPSMRVGADTPEEQRHEAVGVKIEAIRPGVIAG